MNIYVYSDESGVFDKKHNDIFVFGGLAFLDKNSRDIATRKYIKAERDIRYGKNYNQNTELKASVITNKEKSKLYRSLNQYYKFGVVINQKRVFDRIFESKKDKQRYLDYAYKMAVKSFFNHLIRNQIINKNDEINIFFFVDEHTTATNGRYELREGLEQELKRGKYSLDYSYWYPSVFDNLRILNLDFCNSSSKTLIRAADIIANNIYYKAKIKDNSIFDNNNHLLHIIKLP